LGTKYLTGAPQQDRLTAACNLDKIFDFNVIPISNFETQVQAGFDEGTQ
jgi:hypothetical protein